MSTNLAYRFRKQAEFAAGYSPLYQRLFSFVADWLDADNATEDKLVQWLLTAADGRQTLEVTLLLMSGLHQKILAADPAVHDLAQYYPTNPLSHSPLPLASLSPNLFRQTILTLRHQLTPWMQTGVVQTNETGRGLVWLLPLKQLPWPEVELLDLGASAGLNLLADYRHYRLTNEHGQHLLDLGRATSPQFQTICTGIVPKPNRPIHQYTTISSRLGLDLAPFHIHTPADEQRLMSFIWADQLKRFARLREGLDAFQTAQQSRTPIQLHAARLPDELPTFLESLPPSQTPLLIYNTYITQYFKESADQLDQIIGRWAAQLDRPVLWVQWEPYRDARQQQAPHFGWCAWTAALWHNQSHHQWQLGWVHPHGTKAAFGSSLESFAKEIRPMLES